MLIPALEAVPSRDPTRQILSGAQIPSSSSDPRRMPILAQGFSLFFLFPPSTPSFGLLPTWPGGVQGLVWLLPIDPPLEGAGLLLVLGELGSPLHHSGKGVLVQQPQARWLGVAGLVPPGYQHCRPPHLRSSSLQLTLSSSSFTYKLMNQKTSLHRPQALLRAPLERLRYLRYLCERKRKQISI